MRRANVIVAAWAFFAWGCGQLLGVDDLHDCEGGAAIDASDASSDDGEAIDAEAGCGPILHGGTCTPFPQCGCPKNENCEITLPNGFASCTSAGAIPLWHYCSGFGVCGKGAECIGNACKPFCNTAADCKQGGVYATCEQIKNGTYDVPGLKVCSSGCDPIDAGAICGPGVTCNPAPWIGTQDHGDCYGGAGTGVGPDACVNSTTLGYCAPDYYCLTTNECVPWCRVGFDSDCHDAGTCMNFSTPPVIDGVVYGLCQ